MTLCKHRMVLPDKRPAVSTWSQRFACRPTSRPSLPEFLNKCSVHPFLPTPSLCFNTVDGDWNSKTTAFGLLMTGTLTLLILFLLKFFMMQTDGALKQDCGDLTLTLEKRCHFRYKIENCFSCSHLVRRDCDYHMIILVFRDENGITHCYSHV